MTTDEIQRFAVLKNSNYLTKFPLKFWKEISWLFKKKLTKVYGYFISFHFKNAQINKCVAENKNGYIWNRITFFFSNFDKLNEMARITLSAWVSKGFTLLFLNYSLLYDSWFLIIFNCSKIRFYFNFFRGPHILKLFPAFNIILNTST